VVDAPPTGRTAYFPNRASEARAKAEELTDDDSRRMVLEIAAMWDRSAARIDKRASVKVTDGCRRRLTR
jgi:hypothetical protein